MAVLSTSLISDFAKAVQSGTKTSAETTVYGKIVESDGSTYVVMDGSEGLTPVTTTSSYEVGERVMVMIKNHSAVVIGNTTTPSASTTEVKKVDSKATDAKETAEETAEGLEETNANVTANTNAVNVINSELWINDSKVGIDDSLLHIVATELWSDQSKIGLEKSTISALESSVGLINSELWTDSSKIGVSDSLLHMVATQIWTDNTKFGATDSNITAIRSDLDATDATVKIHNSAFTIEDGVVTGLNGIKLNFADIDFANIQKASMGEFWAKSGIMENATVEDETVTGDLIGVRISGDLITAGTLKADKLVILGTDGLYHRLNTDGQSIIDAGVEQTEDNALSGKYIIAQSITADKMSVSDLVAFNAKLANFTIENDETGLGKLYSDTKATVGTDVAGIYLDSSGQMNIGDAESYIKYYKQENGTRKLVIKVDSLTITGSNTTVEDALSNLSSEIQNAKGLSIQIENEYEAISTDADGNYSGALSISSGVVTVFYGTTDVSDSCTYTIKESGGITGSWDDSTRSYTATALATDSGYAIITAAYADSTSGKTLSLSKRFTIAKLKAGAQGEQGVAGKDGEDGKTTYFHVKYSSVESPASSTDMTETPSTYIGTYVDYTADDSDDPTAYNWSRFQGEKGDQGIPGVGADGKTTYLHIAYATSADGSEGFDVSDSTDKTYIGQYTDFTEADSTDYSDYTWSLIKGADGENGRVYSLELSANALKRDSSGTITPASLKVSAYYRDGTSSAKTSFTGKFKVETSSDGSTWTTFAKTADTSSGTDSLWVYTSMLSSSVKHLRFTLYAPAGTTAIDMQTISIVDDGADGADGEDGDSDNLLKGTKLTETDVSNYWELFNATASYSQADPYNGTDAFAFTTTSTDGRISTLKATGKAPFPAGSYTFECWMKASTDVSFYAYLANTKSSEEINLTTSWKKCALTWTFSSVPVLSAYTSSNKTYNLTLGGNYSMSVSGATIYIYRPKLTPSYTAEQWINKITQNGKIKGIFMGDYNNDGEKELYINMDYLRTGGLTLGGANNTYGEMKVLDDSGNTIGAWNYSGIYISSDINMYGYDCDKVKPLGTSATNVISYNNQYIDLSEITGYHLNVGTLVPSLVMPNMILGRTVVAETYNSRSYYIQMMANAICDSNFTVKDQLLVYGINYPKASTYCAVFAGSVQAGGTYGTSDERLKNIGDSLDNEKYLNWFMKMKPIWYSWKNDEKSTVHFGLGAQTTEKLGEECGVDVGHHALIAHSMETNMALDGISDPYSISYNDVSMLTMMVTQKLYKQVQDLESRLKTLEGGNQNEGQTDSTV